MTYVRYHAPVDLHERDVEDADHSSSERPRGVPEGTRFRTVDEMIRHHKGGGTITEEDLRRFEQEGGELTSQDLMRLQNAGVEFSADFLLDRQQDGAELSKEELLRFQKGGTELGMDDLERFLAQGGSLDGKDILRFQRQGGTLTKDDVLKLQEAGVKFTASDLLQLKKGGVELTGADVVALKEKGMELDENGALQLARGGIAFSEEDLARLKEQGVQFTRTTETGFETLGLETPGHQIPEDATWEDIVGMIESGVDIDLEEVSKHLEKHPDMWMEACMWMQGADGKPKVDGINWDSKGDVFLLLAHKGADVSPKDLQEINATHDCFGPKLLTGFETGGYVNYRKEDLLSFSDSGIRFSHSQLAEFDLDLTPEEYCRLSA